MNNEGLTLILLTKSDEECCSMPLGARTKRRARSLVPRGIANGPQAGMKFLIIADSPNQQPAQDNINGHRWGAHMPEYFYVHRDPTWE